MLAAVDVGSNTVRLLLGEIVDGKVCPALYSRQITRLRGGMTDSEGLALDARERTFSVLQAFAHSCSQHGVEKVRAVATAAFRQAVNGEKFAETIQRETGLPLEVITGEQEAALTAAGVLTALDPVPADALIVDIGGGSTEFILCRQGRAIWMISRPLGVVHLTESLADNQERCAFLASEMTLIHDELENVCQMNAINLKNLELVGTAGTATTLAALDMQMQTYDWQQVNNHRLKDTVIHRLHNDLAPLTISERENLPGMEAGRGDLIMAGIEIVLASMQLLGASEFIISDFGLLEGALLSLKDA